MIIDVNSLKDTEREQLPYFKNKSARHFLDSVYRQCRHMGCHKPLEVCHVTTDDLC
jgi:hypothetical protein